MTKPKTLEQLREEVWAENRLGFSQIVQSSGRIVHRFYGIT